MSGPWERFAAVSDGPWTRFATPDATPAPTPVPQEPATRTLSSAPGEALSNLGSSAANFAEAVAQPFLHPVDTAKSIGSILGGIESPKKMVQVTLPNGQKVFQPQDVQETTEQKAQRTAPAEAVGQFFADRYGGWENVKKTMATDPVGFLADAASVLSLGGGAAVRAPGAVGQVAKAVGSVGSAIDPIANTLRAAELTGKGAGLATSAVLGKTTGVGGPVVRSAAREGFEGNPVLLENMRGAPPEGLVDMAESALGKMRQERATEYKAGMSSVKADPTVLDFKPVVEAFADSIKVGTFEGKTINRSAVGTQQQILNILMEWRNSPADVYHTPAGFDALKQTLGDIRDATQPHTPARVVADRVYNSVKKQIEKQAPEYAKTMKSYAEASEKLKEMQKAFSIGGTAADDTGVRKLLSTARNNVTSNYSMRAKMLEELAKHEPNLPAAIAGQTLNSMQPRGLPANLGSMVGLGAIVSNPAIAGVLPAFSPRIVGEAAYGGGRAMGLLNQGASAVGATAPNISAAGQAGYQAGRIDDELRRRFGIPGLLAQ